MRRSTLPAIVAAGAAFALALTGCSSGSSSSESTAAASAPAATAAASEAASGPDSVLSTENIQAVIDAYPGEITKLPTSFGDAEPGALKIGWSEARDANELNNRLTMAIEKEVAKMGGTLTTIDAAGDPGAQVGHIQQLINEGVDAIIVWPLDATALQPSFKAAKAAGIPVIAMEVTPDGSEDLGDITGQVIYGRDQQAYVAATLMSQLFPGGQVATNKFAVPVPSINYYAERAAYWAQQAGLEVVATVDNPSDDVAGGEAMSGPILSKFPDLKGWLAYNDASAAGVTAAARAAGMTVEAFGQNGEDSAIEAIKAGQLGMTLMPPVVDWAKQLVGGAYLAKAGATLPKSVYVGPGTFVSSANVDSAQTLTQVIESAYAG